MAPFGVGNLGPAVVGEPRRDADESGTLIDTLPKVVGIVVVHLNSLLEVDFADADRGSDRRSAKVEEERQSMGIVLDELNALCFVDELLTGLDVVAVGEEEVAVVLGAVGIVGLRELDGDTRQVVVRLDDAVEVVLLVKAGFERGVDGELALPL